MSARLLSEHLKYVLVMELKTYDVYVGQAQRGGSEDPLRYLRQSHLDRKHTHTHTHQKGIKKRQKGRAETRGMETNGHLHPALRSGSDRAYELCRFSRGL